MQFDEYQKEASKTAVYPENVEVVYPALGLANEAGEVLGKIKKVLRGDKLTNLDGVQVESLKASEFFDYTDYETLAAIRAEMGDALWYLSQLATDLGFSLEVIANENLSKLHDRQERNVLKGSGDNR